GRPFGLLLTALAPVIPQILGSVFNIWYNQNVVTPLLVSEALRQRFFETILVFNVVAYPIAIFAWLRLVYSLRNPFRQLCSGGSLPVETLGVVRRRIIHLPWWGAPIAGI